jgi:hypothetical protein
MTAEQKTPLSGRELPLPGVAAICLYLLLIAGIIVVGVAGGGHYPPVFLLLAALFMVASAGLVVSFRWAWAMALSAVFLLTAYNAWILTTQRQLPAAAQGILNLVFFLYLIRPEVRARLR